MTFARPARQEENGEEKTYFKLAQFEGDLLAFKVTSAPGKVRNFRDEMKDTVYADVYVIDGVRAGEVWPNEAITHTQVVLNLKPNVGQIVLGRLVKGHTAFFLDDPTTEEETLAEAAFAKGRAGTPEPAPDDDEPPF